LERKFHTYQPPISLEDAEECSHNLLQDNVIYKERSEMIWTGTGVSANKKMSDRANYHRTV
jgi:hypothetical protein